MTTNSQLDNAATDALVELNSDPLRILRELGIRGGRGSSDCPVQQYLTLMAPTGTNERWYVSAWSAVALDLGDSNPTQRLAHVPLPGQVREFIERFDNGAYTDLCTDERPIQQLDAAE